MSSCLTSVSDAPFFTLSVPAVCNFVLQNYNIFLTHANICVIFFLIVAISPYYLALYTSKALRKTIIALARSSLLST